MLKWLGKVRIGRLLLLSLFLTATLTSSATLMVSKAHAANFKMQTGYYVATNAPMNIRGLGFEPQMLLLRSAGSTNTVYKTSAMPANTIAYLSGTVVNTGSLITFTSDGFDVASGNTNVNGSGTFFYWTAFAGSDCTSSGTFCMGTYTGDGTASRTILTGFEPGMAMVKRTTNAPANFRTASMPVNQAEFFSSATNATPGAIMTNFASNGFTLGSVNNASTGVYYFSAFKKAAGIMNEGAYIGDGTDDRNISGVGFKPDFVVTRNTTSATVANKEAVMANSQSSEGTTLFASITNGALVADAVQSLQPDGFQVGTNNYVNEPTVQFYWFAMGGVVQPPGTGTYTMATGTYTGTGAAASITGVGFKPDLVIIRDGTAASGMMYRSSIMLGSGYIGVAATDITAITSLDTDGFSLNASTNVNASSRTYHWQAFGNAYKPETKSGAADFAIGAYQPTGIDNTFVPSAPGTFDFLHVKQQAGQAGVFRTSEQVGDTTAQLTAAPEIDNSIQSISDGGFEVGTSSTANVVGAAYRWFGFKNSANFSVGSYSGDSIDNRAVTLGSGMQPDLVWVKQTAGAPAYSRPSTVLTDLSLPITNIANVAAKIKTLTTTGMTVGNAFDINSTGNTYRYVAWKKPVFVGVLSGDIVNAAGTSVTTPVFAMTSTGFPYECSSSTGTLGTSAQRIRVSNQTSNAPWTVSIAATNGAAAVWANGGNTRQYDYNDPTASGCTDGGDSDALPGRLRIEPAGATLAPQAGCSANNVTLGSNQDFNQGTVDAITLVSASSGAQTSCYWDITNIHMIQSIPANQPSDTYNINLTITTIAS